MTKIEQEMEDERAKALPPYVTREERAAAAAERQALALEKIQQTLATWYNVWVHTP